MDGYLPYLDPSTMKQRISFLLFSATLLGSLVSCQTTEERPTRRLNNPGDELNAKAWNRGIKSSHFGTPFGMPTSN